MNATSHKPSKTLLWTGRVLTAIPVLLLTMSAIMKLTASRQLLEGFVNKMGYPENSLIPIGIAELLVAVLYAIPRTAVLGAILVTGYLGGATATHVRVSEAFVMPVLVGVMAWAGIWLRDERLHGLLPLRKPEHREPTNKG
jgi:hypothetical protein